jgi:hydrogenase maturation protease
MISAAAGTAMIAIIGCGNPNRRDDGVAGEVLRLLASRGVADVPSRVKLLDAGTNGVAVMFAARGCRKLIIIDACRTGADAGAVFEVPGEELDDAVGPPLATHEFRWDHALAAGRRIFHSDFPDDVTVFLVEAESLEVGLDLTPRVAVAAATVADRIAVLVSSSLRMVESAA